MKNFNINHYIFIQITEDGWKHLKETVGDEYIKHCITPSKEVINNEEWYKLQAHQVFDLLPVGMGSKLLYNTNILINDIHLTEIQPQNQQQK